MKMLIVSCGHIRDLPRRMLLELWARNVNAIAPTVDVLYIDSTSPVDAAAILKPFGFVDVGNIDDTTFIPVTPSDGGVGQRLIARFPEEHPINVGRKDGRSNEAGRAVRQCLLTAIHNEYDWVFYWESDALLAVNPFKTVEKLSRIGVKVAMPWCLEYNYPETQFCFYDTQYLRDTDFVNTYRWDHADAGIDEIRREAAHEAELMILPWRGRHNNTGWVTQENFYDIARLSDGTMMMDWISHCNDFTLYLMFLQLNGIRP